MRYPAIQSWSGLWGHPRIDALCIYKYGLTVEATACVLDPQAVYGDDFPGETLRVLKENEIRKYGENRSQRLVLFYGTTSLCVGRGRAHPGRRGWPVGSRQTAGSRGPRS